MAAYSFEQKLPGTIAFLDFVPYADRPKLLNRTATLDCTSYLQSALDAAAGDKRKGIYFHRRIIVPSRQLVMSGTAYDGIHLVGPPVSGYDPEAPRIQAFSDITPHATYGDYLLWANGVSRFGIDGVNFHMAGFKGDMMWLAYSSFGANFRNSQFAATGGKVAPVTTVDSVTFSGSLINVGLYASEFPVNGRVQVWKRADAVIPNELSDGMVCYVRSRSGGNITLSATLGGPLLTLTGSESGIWGLQRNHWTVENITGGNTVVITNHGFVDGDKVQFSNRSLLLSPEGTVTTSYPSLAVYVKWISANSFRVAATPGGASLALSAHVAGQTVSRVRHGIHGGGTQYGSFHNLWFNETHSSIVMSQYDAPGGIYVGIDSFTWSNIKCNSAPMAISGRGNINGLRFEGYQSAGFVALLQLGADLSNIHIRDFYSEPEAGPAKLCGVSIYNCVGSISGTIGGQGSADTDSISVVHHSPGYRSRVRLDNCYISGWGYGPQSTTPHAAAPQATAYMAFRSGTNDTHNCAQQSFYWDKGVRGDTGVPEADLYNTIIDRPGDGVEHLPTPYWRQGLTLANPGALNTRYGVIHEIDANTAHTISQIADRRSANAYLGPYGFFGAIVARTANTTLATTAFETLSGAAFKLPTNVPYGMICNQDGERLRLLQPLGSVVQTVNPGVQSGNYSVQNAPGPSNGLFDQSPTAGLYSIEGTLNMTTGSSAGTYVVRLTYNDGTARTVDLTGYVGTTLANSFNATTVQIIRFPALSFPVASGNPTLSVTFTGLGTAPSYVPDFAIRRLR